VLTAIEDSVRLAEAMEARGFGGGRRTSYAAASWSARDLAVVGAALGAAGLFVGLRLAGVAVDWYPYPTLYLPPINPALVIGCLALALPSVTLRARARPSVPETPGSRHG
jgi:energy-coupling factor transport system permease protein